MASIARLILATGAILFLSLASYGQYEFNQNCRNAYRSTLTLRFDEARLLLEEEKKINPANLIPVYIENYIDFLTLFIGEQREQYDLMKTNRDGRLKKLEKGDKSSPYYAFCLGQVNLQWGISRLKFGDYTAAAMEIRRAHEYFTDNEQRFPHFLPDNTGAGIVRIMAGMVPDKYKWISSLMGIEGSVEEGLKELREVSGYHGNDSVMRLVKPEAGFYVAMVSANLLNDKKEALPVVAQIENDNPAISANPLLVYGCATILMKNGLNDDALALLSSRKTVKGSFPFQFLDYLEGMARLNKLDPGAELNFQRYIDRFKGMNYLKAAWQKIAWLGLLRGDSATYRQAMLRVKQSGVTQVDEDKQALREAESEMVPSVVLLRARLLFDGGYYQQALGELLNVPLASYVKDRRDLVEYYYRSARIYHESGNLTKALGFYEQTIQRGRTEPWYYAAAAAYQMGLIREQRKQYHEADSAYRICLSMDPAEYKTSLHQKAKAGLARIKPYLD